MKEKTIWYSLSNINSHALESKNTTRQYLGWARQQLKNSIAIFTFPSPLSKNVLFGKQKQWSEKHYEGEKFAYPINIKSGPRRQFECWFALSNRFSHQPLYVAAGVLGCWKIFKNCGLCNFRFSHKQIKFAPQDCQWVEFYDFFFILLPSYTWLAVRQTPSC